jgi:hypothetical protein
MNMNHKDEPRKFPSGSRAPQNWAKAAESDPDQPSGIGQWTGGVCVGDMPGSDARVSGEICSGGEKPGGGTSPVTDKAAGAGAEVGGLRSSVDVRETRKERRETACVDVLKRSDGVVTAGKPATSARQTPGISTRTTAVRRKPSGERHPESRMRENRPSGLMRGGKQKVIGIASHPVASCLLYTARLHHPRLHEQVRAAISLKRRLGTLAHHVHDGRRGWCL